MAKVIKIGHVQDNNDLLVSVISVKPPFLQPVAISSEEYLVGTDFTSGDDLEFQIAGTDKVRIAIFTTNNGTIKTYTEATLTDPKGKKLTVANCATNIKTFIVTST